jgi:hypothetical protein
MINEGLYHIMAWAEPKGDCTWIKSQSLLSHCLDPKVVAVSGEPVRCALTEQNHGRTCATSSAYNYGADCICMVWSIE